MALPPKNTLGDLSILRNDFASAIEDQRDQIAFLGTLWEPTLQYIHPCLTRGSDGKSYDSIQSSTGQDPTTPESPYWAIRDYNKENIIGTVSQSGGVPTGAIIERGSNANGEFVRFADGTQIVYGTQLIAFNIDAQYGAIWTKVSANLSWPAAFTDAPSGSLETRDYGGGTVPWAEVRDSYGGGCYFDVWDVQARTGLSYYVRFFSVGRWY